jgi:hypothetical protein
MENPAPRLAERKDPKNNDPHRYGLKVFDTQTSKHPPHLLSDGSKSHTPQQMLPEKKGQNSYRQ